MAIGNVENLFEIESAKASGIEWNNIRMLEMGSIKRKCHYIVGDPVQNKNIKAIKKLGIYPSGGAKHYYLSILGVTKHVSIDFNGAWGSLKYNLDLPLPDDFHNGFNLITNYGTGEHVNDQHSFFKNVHDCCEVGGVMIHALNAPGYVLCHGRYEYELQFIDEIARVCEYDVILVRPGGYYKSHYSRKGDNWYNKVHFAAFRKTSSKDFIDPAGFGALSIVDTGFTARTGDYNSSKTKSKVRKLKRRQIKEYHNRKKQ